MKYHFFSAICFFFLLPLGPTTEISRDQNPLTALSPGLFDQDEPLNIQLSGNVRSVFDDRGDNPAYHPMVLSYKGDQNQDVPIPVEVKTRGHFRKSRDNCAYPPLLISFSKKESVANTLFSEQNKVKLVMPCTGDQYVVKEWLVYKLYNLITPKSFQARLVKVIFSDPEHKKPSGDFFGILLEEEHQVAARNHAVTLEKKLLRPENTEADPFLKMAVFEYMIANTDWSVQYLQNIKLLAPDSNSIPTTVPYDFDHAGIVSTPYALPAEELQMSSVRERRYRGYCVTDMKKFDPAIALFNSLKDSIYAVYTHCTLLDAKYIKNTTEYLDAFYKTINSPAALKKAFQYPCDPGGTGNVVIHGLSKD